MTDTTIRLFEKPNACLFQLSPLYAEPGWYGTADASETVGPFATAERVQKALDALESRRGERHSVG